nr:hypothetical protein [Desulfosporosinus nitroreducens]
MKTVTVPSGYSIRYGATQKNMADSFASLGLALGASLALVYMILVVLYESFLTPAKNDFSSVCDHWSSSFIGHNWTNAKYDVVYWFNYAGRTFLEKWYIVNRLYKYSDG